MAAELVAAELVAAAGAAVVAAVVAVVVVVAVAAAVAVAAVATAGAAADGTRHKKKTAEAQRLDSEGARAHRACLMSWPVVHWGDDACPERGLEALSRLPSSSWLIAAVWIGVAIGADRCLVSTRLLLTSSPQRAVLLRRLRVLPRYVLPHGLALLWSATTAASVVLVPLTHRSKVALTFKMAHVVVEGTFLACILLEFGAWTLASLVVCALVGIFVFVVTTPCVATVTLAATAGGALDVFNWLAHLAVAVFQCDNRDVWTAVVGFGWHLLYVCNYIVLQRMRAADETLLDGAHHRMFFTLAGTFVFVDSARRALHPETSASTLSEWNEVLQHHPHAAWSPDGTTLATWNDVDDSGTDTTLVPLHTAANAPSKLRIRFLTAARRVARHVQLYAACLPWGSRATCIV